ncbi:hypothetical protein AJ78_05156 [Emergomyces pasteurianus Ep9510]|uniref:Uncharacterized protein n=1 Tax=Emergomyces pasteurianus Ep9510 TaxID=1447872 RepID=A0A1J9PEV6_9EURO|nr:hypothetical protein AJ78_05156 [Emergomyces pasteurianus Ep9510]
MQFPNYGSYGLGNSQGFKVKRRRTPKVVRRVAENESQKNAQSAEPRISWAVEKAEGECAATMSHTASQTWLSNKTKEFEAWGRVRDMMEYVAPKSPFTPKSFEEWIAHRLAWMEEERGRLVSQAITRRVMGSGRSEQNPVSLVLGGKELPDGLALILARETIWIPHKGDPSVRNSAPWPSYEELKHEGDDRSKSGYSRFPPLPRRCSNATVNWKQRVPVKQCLFDEVGRPVWEGVSIHTQDLESEMLRFVDSSLLEELGV